MSNMTWRDLKRAANRIPESRLDDQVFIWTDRDDDASVFKVQDIEVLKEDYLKSDEGCAPRSVMKDTIAEEKEMGTYDADDFRVIHPKGRRIIFAE